MILVYKQMFNYICILNDIARPTDQDTLRNISVRDYINKFRSFVNKNLLSVSTLFI